MIALGIDVGKARIGVAFNLGSLILAHGVIPRNPQAASEIVEVARLRQAERVFVGLPLSLDGGQTASTADALNFAKELAENGLAVFLIDERLTTKSAAQSLRNAGKAAEETKGIIDSESARVILESALSNSRSIPLEEFDA